MPAILRLITIILNQNQKMHRRLDKETDLSSFKHSCIFYCMWGINIANHLTFIKYSSRNVKKNHEHLARDFHLFGKNKSMKCIVISQKLLIHLFNNLPMFTMEKKISVPQIENERQTERLGYVYKYSTFYVFF